MISPPRTMQQHLQRRGDKGRLSSLRELIFVAPLIAPLKVSSPWCGLSPNLRPDDLTGSIKREGSYPAAHGGFGDIWKCVWKRESKPIRVAVKALRPQVTNEEDRRKKCKRLQRELNVWQRLEHENVLPLLGITSDFGPFTSMVCPWLDNGTLSVYLERRQHKLTAPHRFLLLIDIAAGLRYLHSCSVIHGDLTGSNILIDRHGRACLADFGLSILMLEFHGASYFTSSIRGAVRWAAPELYGVLGHGEISRPSTRSDIYSFGSILLQVLSGRIPYHHLKNDAQVLIEISRGITPARSHCLEIADSQWDFIQRCWSTYNFGATRPSIDEIIHFLDLHLMLSSARTVITINLAARSQYVSGLFPCPQTLKRTTDAIGPDETGTSRVYPSLHVALEPGCSYMQWEATQMTLVVLLNDLCFELGELLNALTRWTTKDIRMSGVSSAFVRVAEDIKLVAQVLELLHTSKPREIESCPEDLRKVLEHFLSQTNRPRALPALLSNILTIFKSFVNRLWAWLHAVRRTFTGSYHSLYKAHVDLLWQILEHKVMSPS
ncbi:kinase-like protein [Leucogyrophana mollusca]|uniref:Kinase-like protein n=1 Tax=Leucogyrophana mollusca TaxID=85980 RepID=A0ACB8BR75_9AGAM|nr:kinase-like protein [Leucogyrophana mollusca]